MKKLMCWRVGMLSMIIGDVGMWFFAYNDSLAGEIVSLGIFGVGIILTSPNFDAYK